MGLSIEIAIEHDAWTAIGDLDAIASKAAEAALLQAKSTIAEGAELSLVFCDDAFIRNLNRDWRSKDSPTNVLSFPADPSVRDVTLGDIVIAYETVAREAEDERRPVTDHLTHLIIHGLLHLLGHDHESDLEAERMEKLEVLALRHLGIASPYEDAAPLSARQ